MIVKATFGPAAKNLESLRKHLERLQDREFSVVVDHAMPKWDGSLDTDSVELRLGQLAALTFYLSLEEDDETNSQHHNTAFDPFCRT